MKKPFSRLRERKHREEKPFALMFPSLASVKAVCEVSPLEERLLRSPEAPIVLLRKNRQSANRQIGNSVAPGNPEPRRDAAVQSAASFADGGTWIFPSSPPAAI